MPVYILRSELTGDDSPVKIGYTDALCSRMATFQTGSSRPIEVIRLLDGGRALETSLHERFSDLRIDREWFHFTFEMVGDLGADDLPIPDVLKVEYRTRRRDPDDGLKLIRSIRGLSTKIARELGITKAAITMWAKVPAERLFAVERITGIPRHKLRPDICRNPESAP